MAKQLLGSWQEIADYLDRSVRTVQRWERERGLPVHRPEADDKGRRSSVVYARPEELDQWLGKTPEISLAAPGSGASQGINSPKRWRQYFLFTGLAGLALFTLWLAFKPTPIPSWVRIEQGNRLVVEDVGGNEIWSYTYPGGRLREAIMIDEPIWKIVDLNGDQSPEVIFALQDKEKNTPPPMIRCSDAEGRKLWEYETGGLVVWDGRKFQNHYRLFEFSARGLRADGTRFVVAIVNQNPMFPAQVSIIDPSGNLTGEYWHTGYIFAHELADLDQDGTDEIIIGGINRAAPFLAVIEHDIKDSISPTPPGYNEQGRETGKEFFYASIPTTDVADALRIDSRVMRIRWDVSLERLTVEVELNTKEGEQLERVYFFNRDLAVIDLVFPQTFESFRREQQSLGLLDSDADISESEKARLKQLEVLVDRRR